MKKVKVEAAHQRLKKAKCQRRTLGKTVKSKTSLVANLGAEEWTFAYNAANGKYDPSDFIG